MDDLFQQMANISKAHGYDILAEQVKELKTENEALKAQLDSFYMDICRAYNAGKKNAILCMAEGDDKFIASHDYFLKEFPNHPKPY